ncbi:MAG: BamA/TamA family outer membrane protein [Gemmatimonadaceae bacterium]
MLAGHGWLAMFALVTAPVAVAQQPEKPPPLPTGWEFVGLPALNFSTDEGFGYGALLEAYNYGSGAESYRFTIQPTIFLTTKGRRDFTVFFDAPALLGNGWRLDAFAGREQELATPYYGRGNFAVRDTALTAEPNPYFYTYGRTRVRLLANVQRPIASTSARYLLGAGYAHARTDDTPFDSGTTFMRQELAGAAAPGGTLAYLRAGIVFDTRDREIGPRTGWWNEVMVQRVDKVLGASHSYTRVSAAARRYVPVTSRLTGAFRLVAQQASGDVPLYDLATVQTSFKQEEGLGGSKMLRGIPKNRVVGKGMVVLNNELRWRFADFSVMKKPAYLVLNGFLDTGRVWEESIRASELTSDLWTGYGTGLRLGLGPSFVVAFDLGRSSETTQIYIGLGYAF